MKGTKYEVRVLAAIKENPNITIAALAQIMGVSQSTVSRVLKKLKDEKSFSVRVQTSAANGSFSEYILSTLSRQQKTTTAKTAKQLPERVRKAMNHT